MTENLWWRSENKLKSESSIEKSSLPVFTYKKILKNMRCKNSSILFNKKKYAFGWEDMHKMMIVSFCVRSVWKMYEYENSFFFFKIENYFLSSTFIIHTPVWFIILKIHLCSHAPFSMQKYSYYYWVWCVYNSKILIKILLLAFSFFFNNWWCDEFFEWNTESEVEWLKNFNEQYKIM